MLDGWWFHWKCKDCGLQMYSADELPRLEQLCGMCTPTTFKDAATRAAMWIDRQQGKMAERDKLLDRLDELEGSNG
jgi:acetyl-CoA carboxylase beta subunit